MSIIPQLIKLITQQDIDNYILSEYCLERNGKDQPHYECCEICNRDVWGECPICCLEGTADLTYKYSCEGNYRRICVKHGGTYESYACLPICSHEGNDEDHDKSLRILTVRWKYGDFLLRVLKKDFESLYVDECLEKDDDYYRYYYNLYDEENMQEALEKIKYENLERIRSEDEIKAKAMEEIRSGRI